MKTKYVSTLKIEEYLKGRRYSCVHFSGNIRAMKKNYGWDKCVEIVRSGQFIYGIYE